MVCFSDVNECTERTADCEQTCENTNGSFVCSCIDGYTPNTDNTTCTISKLSHIGIEHLGNRVLKFAVETRYNQCIIN